jgi:hypothetical protein
MPIGIVLAAPRASRAIPIRRRRDRFIRDESRRPAPRPATARVTATEASVASETRKDFFIVFPLPDAEKAPLPLQMQ